MGNGNTKKNKVEAELIRTGINASYEGALDYMVARMAAMRNQIEQNESLNQSYMIRIDDMMKRVVNAEVQLRSIISSQVESDGGSSDIGIIYALGGMTEILSWIAQLMGECQSSEYGDGIPSSLLVAEQKCYNGVSEPLRDDEIPF